LIAGALVRTVDVRAVTQARWPVMGKRRSPVVDANTLSDGAFLLLMIALTF
jgi:hypothetical protein